MKKEVCLIGNLALWILSLSGLYAQDPVIGLIPDSLSGIIYNCNDSAVTSLTINNSGSAPLMYNIIEGGPFFDDFDHGLSKWTLDPNWGLQISGYNGSLALTESPYNYYSDNWDNYAMVKDSMTVINKDSAYVSFYTFHELECYGDITQAQISVNGGPWQSIGTISCWTYSAYMWDSTHYDFSNLVSNGDYVRFRFYFHSDDQYNYNGTTIENLRISGVGTPISWFNMYAGSGILGPGESAVVNFTFNADGLNGGIYRDSLVVITNDPSNPMATVPVKMTVIGNPEINNSYPIWFGEVYVGGNNTDTVYLMNTGCANLVIDSIQYSVPQFSTVFLPDPIPPGSYGNFGINFAPSEINGYTESMTIYFNNNAITFELLGNGLGAPLIDIIPDTLYGSLSDCNDSVDYYFEISNQGFSDLTVSFAAGGISDTMSPASCVPGRIEYCCDIGIQHVQFNTINFSTGGGWQGYQDYTSVANTFVELDSTYTITVQTGCCNDEKVLAWLDYNNDGTFQEEELVFFSDTTGSIHVGQITIPGDGVPINTPLRLRIVSDVYYNDTPDACSGTYYGQYQDYSVVIRKGLKMLSDTSIIWPGTQNYYVARFYAKGLTNGFYNLNLLVYSNDPLQPIDTLNIQTYLNGPPNPVSSANAQDFGPIMENTTTYETFWLKNTGCGYLQNGVYMTSSAEFLSYANWPYGEGFWMAPGDSALFTTVFTPTLSGVFADTLFFYFDNASSIIVPLYGEATGSPKVGAVPDSLFANLAGCNDSITQTVILHNEGTIPLNWSIPAVNTGHNLRFTAPGQQVNCGDLGTMPARGTIEFWVWADQKQLWNNCLGMTGADTSDWESGIRFALGTWSDFYVLFGNESGQEYTYTLTYNFTLNSWHHIAVSWDVSQNRVNLYFDGVFKGQWENLYWPSQLRNLTMGSGFHNTRNWLGKLDEVRIWSEARTEQEIQYYKNFSLSGNENNLLAYYDFNEGSGNAVHNKAGTQFNGIFSGASWELSTLPFRSFFSVSPLSGSLAAGDSTQLGVTFKGLGWATGSYHKTFSVLSNDPINPDFIIACNLNVMGSSGLVLSDSVMVYDSLMIGLSQTDSLGLYNMGCDTLFASISHNDASFFLADSVITLQAFGYKNIPVFFSPVTNGLIIDTLQFNTNAGNLQTILRGFGRLAPALSFQPDSLYLEIQECNDTLHTSVSFTNTGQAPLHIQILPDQSFIDDFEKGLRFWNTGDHWGITSQAYSGISALAIAPDGQYGDDWITSIETRNSLRVVNKDSASVSFYIKYSLECWNDDLLFQISVNGGEWYGLVNYTCYSSGWLQVNLPLKYYVNVSDEVKFRFLFTSNSNTTNTGAIIDNFQVKGITTIQPWTHLLSAPSVIAQDSSFLINLVITTSNLNAGFYYDWLNFSSDDPLHPIIHYPITLLVSGTPVLNLSTQTIDFGDVMKYTTAHDSLVITNPGCDTLYVSSLSLSKAEFISAMSQVSVLPLQSIKVPLSFTPESLGLVSDTLRITSNAQNTTVLLKGNGLVAPSVSVNPDSLSISTSCGNTITIPFKIRNSGDGTLGYQVDNLSNLMTGLMAYYPFNGNVNDATLKERNLTNHGVVHATGVKGEPSTAAFFNGNSFLSYNDTADFTANLYLQNLSVSMWLKFDQLSDLNQGTQFLFNLAGVDQNAGTYNIYVAFHNLYVTGRFNGVFHTISTPIDTSGFMHIITTWDGQRFRLYKNGVIASEYTGWVELGAYGFLEYYTYSNPTFGIGGFSKIPNYLNYGSNFKGALDEFRLYNRAITAQEVHDLYKLYSPLGGITTVPPNGSVIPGDSSNIQLTINTNSIPAGHHHTSLVLRSNDPVHPEIFVPLELELAGTALAHADSTCIHFDSLVQFNSRTDSIRLYNQGCDTLWIEGLLTSSPSFQATAASPFVPPFTSRWIHLLFHPQSQGWIYDTLNIQSNANDQKVCLSGYCKAIPAISLSTASLTKVMACEDIAAIPLVVANTGLAALQFHFVPASVPNWIHVPPGSIQVNPLSQDTTWLMFDRTDLSSGLFTGTLQLVSNDPLHPALSVNVYLFLPYSLVKPNLGQDTGYCQSSFYLLNPGSFRHYLWNTGDTTTSLTATQPGTYWVRVADNYECISTDTISLSEIPYPVAQGGDDTSICAGYSLNMTGLVSNMPARIPKTIQIGHSSGYGYLDASNPFGTSYREHRTQMLYFAEELMQSGLGAGPITSFAFNLLYIGLSNISDITVRLGSTNQTSLSGFIPGLSSVWSGTNFHPAMGWNTFTLNNPYIWDGQSNLVVEICFHNNMAGNNSVFQYTWSPNTVFGNYCNFCGDGCSLAGGFSDGYRPNLKITGVSDFATYSWKGPNGLLSQSQTALLQNIQLSDSGTYTFLLTNRYGCADSSQLHLQVNPSPAVNAGPDQTVLFGDSISLDGSFTGLGGPYIISWTPVQGLNNAAIASPRASPPASAPYVMGVSGNNGCQGRDSVMINVIPRYLLSGHITYNNAYYSSLNNVNIILKNTLGDAIDTVSTDQSGNYQFGWLQGGQYSVEATSVQAVGSINATDALVMARHGVGLQLLSGLRLTAADVNNSHTVSGADALLTLRHSAGLINTFPAGDWVFEKKSFSISNTDAIVDLFGLAVADVNGSFNPNTKETPAVEAEWAGFVFVTNPDEIVVPLRVARDISLGAISLEIQFPEELLLCIDLQTELSGFVFKIFEDHINIAWCSLEGRRFKPDETMFTLVFRKQPGVLPMDEAMLQVGSHSEFAGTDGNPLSREVLLIPKILDKEPVNDGFYLGQNIPNPAGTNTLIPYFLPVEGYVRLQLCNLLGESISMLVNKEMAAGYHTLQLNLTAIPAGSYIYSIDYHTADQIIQAYRRMVVTH